MPIAPGKVTMRTTAPATHYDAARPSAPRRGYDRVWYHFLAAYRAGAGCNLADPLATAQEIDRRNRCAHCGARGRLDYDHITPLQQGGARLDPANIQPLCRSCHVAKTRREQRLCQN